MDPLVTREGINDPGLEPIKTRNIERSEEALRHKAEEMRQAPSRDLIACIFEEVNSVFKMAQGSKNLKGFFVRALNASYITLRTAAGVIAQGPRRGLHSRSPPCP